MTSEPHSTPGLSPRAPRLGALTVVVVCLSAGAGNVRLSATTPTPQSAQPVPTPRDVRVLLSNSAESVRIRSPRLVLVRDGEDRQISSMPANQWIQVRAAPAGGVQVQARTWAIDTVILGGAAEDGMEVSVLAAGTWSDPAPYPGRMLVRRSGANRISVQNLVDLERYVACVVAGEVWPGFSVEACRAQAIAARTYVLSEMMRRDGRAYDVVASPAAQAYRGLRTDAVGRRAAEAAEYTRGIVCTWSNGGQAEIFPTYYSAVCGGVSQSSAVFSGKEPILPLAGGVPCDYCSIAPGGSYRWGPVRLTLQELTRRLTADQPALARLGQVRSVRVSEREDSGRPLTIQIEGSSGRSATMSAEEFRLSVGTSVLRSTYCDISVQGSSVVFSNGRGFGHGVGLCQWGMQAQSLAGRRADEILLHYYPGASLTRAY